MLGIQSDGLSAATFFVFWFLTNSKICFLERPTLALD